MARKKKKNLLSNLGDIGMGVGKLGVSLPVAAAVGGRAIAQAPVAQQAALGKIQGGVGQVARVAPIAVTVGAGGALLGGLKKLNKKDKHKMFYTKKGKAKKGVF